MSIDQEPAAEPSKTEEPWIKLNARQEKTRAELRQVLQATIDHEQCRAARAVLVHVLACLGVLQWFTGHWPSILPAGVATIVDAVWLPCLAGTIALIVLERIFAFRRRRSLADYS